EFEGPPAAGARNAGRQRATVQHAAFFFSSRRRHTRSKRDWSSDVCSSDLIEWPKREFEQFEDSHVEIAIRVLDDGTREISVEYRSEERRVGKECRGRREAYDEKEKVVIEMKMIGNPKR